MNNMRRIQYVNPERNTPRTQQHKVIRRISSSNIEYEPLNTGIRRLLTGGVPKCPGRICKSRTGFICCDASVNNIRLLPGVRKNLSLNTRHADTIRALIYVATLFTASTNFLNYNARDIEGNVNSTTEPDLSNVILALERFSVCRETCWRFRPSTRFTRPSNVAYTRALTNTFNLATFPFTIERLKNLLYANNVAAIIINTFDSFYSSSTRRSGVVQLPTESETQREDLLVVVYGYNSMSGRFACRSYGAIRGWGRTFDFTIPSGYIGAVNYMYYIAEFALSQSNEQDKDIPDEPDSQDD